MPKELSREAVRNLTPYQRDVLLQHIDCPVDVVASNAHMTGVRNSLIRIGMLRGATPGNRPRATVLTELGRMAVGMVLGEYADALARAGLLDPDYLLAGLQRLKAAKAPIPARTALEPAEMALLALEK